MKTIHKYTLHNTGKQPQVLSLPKGAKLLKIGWQQDNIQMWCRVDPDAPSTQFTYWVYGTGFPMDEEDLVHAETVITPAGFVWHIFLASQNEYLL